ncbi:MAG TPA: hypothetical protein VKM72_12515 [Thermoanaerobaculia bacterium]|nr:hypothetical protein [Thermoanaerobaculia bacterium]
MKSNRTIAEVVASLESQLAFYREKEELHARHEAFHREQRTLYGTEREKIERNLEAFGAAASGALELAEKTLARPAEAEESADLGSASNPRLGKMVEFVLAGKGQNEPFGPVGLASDVNRRFGNRLRRSVDARQISVVLRRMERLRRIHLVRKGRPHWEALYSRGEG